MMQTFYNVSVLVTGAASGIGRATALAFAAAGAKVLVVDRQAEGSAETVSQIEAAGGQAISAVVDVTDADAVADLVKTAVHAFGRLDVAVNNAGILGAPAPLHDTDEDRFEQVLNVNLRGVFLCMKYAKSNIRINAVCPSIIETPMTTGDHIPPDLMAKYLSVHPMRRAGKPEEVANAILWLASEGASFINGVALTVDGGAIAQ
jgi:NAD(P)-dependent dehydrogenase (short-subunit alcohol dehydrogenase family)